MINSKEQYIHFLKEDKRALGIVGKSKLPITLNPFEIDLEIWRFQRQLRKCEYLQNVNKSNILWKFRKFLAAKQLKKLSCILGFTINPNCFREGLRIAHRGTIVVNGRARIGANCIINACVNIGATPGDENAVPVIGNNVYIGPGAKIYGKIYIADGCIIGANAVVNKDCYEPNMLIIGVPATPRKRN